MKGWKIIITQPYIEASQFHVHVHINITFKLNWTNQHKPINSYNHIFSMTQTRSCLERPQKKTSIKSNGKRKRDLGHRIRSTRVAGARRRRPRIWWGWSCSWLVVVIFDLGLSASDFSITNNDWLYKSPAMSAPFCDVVYARSLITSELNSAGLNRHRQEA